MAINTLPLVTEDVIVGAEESGEAEVAATSFSAARPLFEQFAQHSSNALWIAHATSGRFEYLNPVAERGWAAQDGGACATLEQWTETLHPDDRDAVARWRANVVDGEPQRLSYRRIEGGATSHYIETSFRIPASGDQPALVAGIAENILSDLPIYSAELAPECDAQFAAILKTTGNRHKRFATLGDLLFAADALLPGCIFIGAHGPQAACHEAVRQLRRAAPQSPIVVLAPATVAQDAVIGALKAGAIDYLTAPLRAEDIVNAIFAARTHAGSATRQSTAGAPSEPDRRLADLPKRAREVLLGLLEGGTNKTIGRTLGISPRTVEAHRAHLMERLNARSLPELLRTALQAGLGGGRSRGD